MDKLARCPDSMKTRWSFFSEAISVLKTEACPSNDTEYTGRELLAHWISTERFKLIINKAQWSLNTDLCRLWWGGLWRGINITVTKIRLHKEELNCNVIYSLDRCALNRALTICETNAHARTHTRTYTHTHTHTHRAPNRGKICRISSIK